MNVITIRNLSPEASQQLEARAAENGTTAAAEAERILQEVLGNDAVGTKKPEIGLGTALRQLREKYPELADVDFSRDQTPAGTVSFE